MFVTSEFISKSISMNSDSQKTIKKTPTWVELKRVTLQAKLSQFSHDWATKTSAISPIWVEEFLDTLGVCCLRVTCEALRAQRPRRPQSILIHLSYIAGPPSAVWFTPLRKSSKSFHNHSFFSKWSCSVYPERKHSRCSYRNISQMSVVSSGVQLYSPAASSATLQILLTAQVAKYPSAESYWFGFCL